MFLRKGSSRTVVEKLERNSSRRGKKCHQHLMPQLMLWRQRQHLISFSLQENPKDKYLRVCGSFHSWDCLSKSSLRSVLSPFILSVIASFLFSRVFGLSSLFDRLIRWSPYLSLEYIMEGSTSCTQWRNRKRLLLKEKRRNKRRVSSWFFDDEDSQACDSSSDISLISKAIKVTLQWTVSSGKRWFLDYWF